MLALIQCHLHNHKLNAEQFFRTCYYWKFQKDISEAALHEDVKTYNHGGSIRPYVVDYLLHIYGAM